MTVRDLIQSILLNAPDLDAIVYVTEVFDEIDAISYEIDEITSKGNNDSLILLIKSVN